MSMNERLRAQLNLINLSASYKACFCDEGGNLTKAGARVLRDLGHFGHLGKTTVKVSPTTRVIDTHATMVAEGRRDTVRRIWAYIDMDPTTHPMMKETTDE